MLRRVQVARSRLEDAMYIEVKDLKKSYGTGDSKVQVLRGVTTEVEQGKMCVIQGTSGSGKSTLLNCIGGLDTIDSGSVVVNGTEEMAKRYLLPIEMAKRRLLDVEVQTCQRQPEIAWEAQVLMQRQRYQTAGFDMLFILDWRSLA